MQTIKMEVITGVNFQWHAQNGEIVIDVCEGITPSQGLALFDEWMVDALLEKSNEV